MDVSIMTPQWSTTGVPGWDDDEVDYKIYQTGDDKPWIFMYSSESFS